MAGNSGGDEESAHVTLSKSDVILTFQIEVKIFFSISLDKELTMINCIFELAITMGFGQAMKTG